MVTIATIEINDTLHVDVTRDPPGVDIRRLGAGLVRIDAHELRRLVEVLTLAGGDLAALAVLEDDHD